MKPMRVNIEAMFVNMRAMQVDIGAEWINLNLR